MSGHSSSWSSRNRRLRATEPDEVTAYAAPGSSPDAAAAADPASVMLESGPESGLVFPLDEKATIGRSPDNDIVLPDETVSRRHASIERREGRYVLVDRGSTNGCWLLSTDGRRRLEGEHALISGDRLQLGPYRLVFRGSSSAEARAAS